MPRALILVLDSFGCGGAADAAAYGDAGADTLGHIASACMSGRADRPGLREGPLAIPHLTALGLGEAASDSTGRRPVGIAPLAPRAAWGCACEISKGKDTPSGHWELAGAPAAEDFGYFPDARPAFPPQLIAALIERAQLPGILGARHASGVEIVEEFGEESRRSGKPICYTSSDSVFQIAAHENAFGLERLYATCRIARSLCDSLRIARVIARPFAGGCGAPLRRTPNRKDFSIPPPAGNLLDRAAANGRSILSFGKIGDIFDHRATGREIKGASNDALLDALVREWPAAPDGGLAFVNLVDFDTEYGHRRDPAGYAACIETFDARLAEIEAILRADDLLVITADHGNDPTWRGMEHTRENVPILCFSPRLEPRGLGRRTTFADIGASVAAWLALPSTSRGSPFLTREDAAG